MSSSKLNKYASEMTKDFRELGERTCIRAPSEMTKKIALKKKQYFRLECFLMIKVWQSFKRTPNPKYCHSINSFILQKIKKLN